jgi:hypothetical protein
MNKTTLHRKSRQVLDLAGLQSAAAMQQAPDQEWTMLFLTREGSGIWPEWCMAVERTVADLLGCLTCFSTGESFGSHGHSPVSG